MSKFNFKGNRAMFLEVVQIVFIVEFRYGCVVFLKYCIFYGSFCSFRLFQVLQALKDCNKS